MNLYEDMICLPRPVSERHAPMTRADRAAQFSSFAALRGYDEAVAETARLTEAERFLDESEKELLDRQLRQLADRLRERPEISLCYFAPDLQKEGGCYETVTGAALRLDEVNQELTMENGDKIPFYRILSLEFLEEPEKKDV